MMKIAKVIRFIFIILTLPAWLFWSFLPVLIFLHVHPPIINFLYRLHNDFNPKAKIKGLLIIDIGGKRTIEDNTQTFSGWIKEWWEPELAQLSILFFGYHLCCMFFSTLIPYAIYDILLTNPH